MENLHKNFGAECFLLAYDQFTARRRFVESFCGLLIDKKLNYLPWYCISRLDSVDADLLGLMKEAGCESMCYGIDSGSKRTLSFIRKNIDKEILYQRVVETADQGIIPTLSFVIGFPEEEKEDIDETLLIALRTGIVGNSNPLIQLPTVLPGTDLSSKYADRLVREVDTYFALGLEFDKGKRLSSDEELINSDPFIFSSFYNLPCPGRRLEELNLIASFFPLMVQLYPKTFLMLSIESKKSVSGLFIQWLSWLKRHLNREGFSLSPQDCYLHFRKFVSDVVRKTGQPTKRHFPDVLKYETVAIEAGKLTGDKKGNFNIDFSKIHEVIPLKNEMILIEEFDFNLPMVIMDLKVGSFDEQYRPKKTLLVFRQEDDLLHVSEINPFARDFLGLCDGRATLDAISKALYNSYGEDMGPKEFFDSCVEGLRILGEKRLVETGLPQDPPRKGGESLAES